MKDFLLEIGVEELPARFVGPALEQLRVRAEAQLAGASLTHGEVGAFGTPRRLAVWVKDVPLKSGDKVQESLGPALAQAKDAQGQWTHPALGFARSQGMVPEQLETRQTDKGPRLCAVRRTPGQSTEKILTGLLPDLIGKIHFPKTMVWEESRFSFARPLRWIVALYGNSAVKFELAGVKSGRKTWGLLVQSPKPLDVPSPARYVDVLKDKCVVVDPAERRRQIEAQIQQVVRDGVVPVESFGDLLDEVVNLVEHPVAILGSFEPRYIALPPEILVTSMKKHQKFFPLFDGEGKLKPFFVGIRNGLSENQAVVREGYERVLAARLADAAFFFEQDRKEKLENRVPQLKGVLFQKDLGTLWEKTERVIQLAGSLADKLNLGKETAHQAPRVAYLAKADLVTHVVGEFPELQGIMGRIYAALDGEPASVAKSVEQHYWPLTADGELPKETAAAVASLADKLDTLAGYFLVNIRPSGSQDPYGLRRASVGILRLLSDRGWRLNLSEAVGQAVNAFPRNVAGDRDKAKAALLDFFKQRWAALMEARGYKFDEVQAVAAAGFDDVVDAEARLAALKEIRNHPDFAPLAIAFKRAANILTQARQKNILPAAPSVVEGALADPAERALFDALRRVQADAHPRLDGGRYAEALRGMVTLRAEVDRFFEGVMVMAPEPAVRDNRLALLHGIATLIRRVADFAQLQS